MPAFVQQTNGGTTSASTTATVTLAAVTSGNLLMLSTWNNGTSVTISSVSGCGATWTKLQAGGTNVCEMWVGTGVTSGTTVSVTFASAVSAKYAAQEFSGVVTAASSAVATGTSTAPATAAVSATASGQIAYGAFFQNEATAPSAGGFTDTPSAYTDITRLSDGVLGVAEDISYLVTTGAGTCQRVGTNSTSAFWVGFGAILAPGAAPAYRSPQLSVVRQAVRRASVI